MNWGGIMNIMQINDRLFINGKEIEQSKSLFFKNTITTINNKIYINGKEKIKGKWKYTIKSVFYTLFQEVHMQQLKTCKRKTLDDEFYTMYRDCVRELHKYDLRNNKIIFNGGIRNEQCTYE